MADSYADILLRIFPYEEKGGYYPVEAELDDGSRFTGGQLRLDDQALLAQHLNPEGYGLLLFNALFAGGGDIRRAYDKATGKAEAETGGRVRVRLWVDDEAVELHAIPWERLYHLHKGRPVPLGASALTPLSRYTSLEIREPLPITETPIRVLVAVSNPTHLPGGLAPANVDLEIDNLRRALSELRQQNKVHVTVMPGRTGLTPALRTRLEAEGYAIVEGVTNLFNIAPHLTQCHVFHFIGHGAFRKGSGGRESGAGDQAQHGTAALYLEKADGAWQAAKDEEIASMFAVLGTLPHLVFLVACESAKREAQATSPFVGLGPKLVQAGVPAVVAMQEQVPVEMARTLASEFYGRLAEHGEVDRALNQARAQIFNSRGIEWAIPVLFMRIRKGRLFGADLDEDAPAPGDPPFKGLEYFNENDARKFYGRELLTARLVGKLRLSRFLPVIVGASGSGKSSVVRAGLIPALKRGEPLADGTRPPEGSRTWATHVLTPGAHPLEALAVSLTRDAESMSATTTLLEDLRMDERTLHFHARKRLGERPGANRLLVIVDQFEEIFTLCKDDDERRAFINGLLHASSEKTDGPTVVIIIFRADFYAHCAQYDNLRAAVSAHQEFVGPMTKEELRRAIEEPAKAGGWDFEPGLVDLILKEVGDEPGALPLMQHALLETWKRRRARTMTLRGYNDAGGIRGAIARTAEAIYAQLPAEQHPIAKRIFLRLVELGEGTQDTRRRALLEELSPNAADQPLIDTVLKKLADNRLVVTTATTVEVAHEALIREWPTFREWINQNREALRIHRDLGEGAREWDNLMRESGVLYRGVKLIQALEWAEEHGTEMNELEAAFITTSKSEAEREAYEKEEQQQRELAAAKKLADEQARVAEAAQKLAEAEKQRAAERAEADRKQIASAKRGRTSFIVFSVAAAIMAGVAFVSCGQAADARNKAYEAGTQVAEQGFLALTERANAEVASTRAVAQQARAEAASTLAVEGQTAAETERLRAESQAQLALSRQLAAQSALLPSEQLDLALLLGVEAYEIQDTLEARDSLLRAHVLNPRLKGYAFSPTEFSDMAVTPDGRILALSSSNTIHLWGWADAAGLRALGEPLRYDSFGFFQRLALSPNGTILVIVGCAPSTDESSSVCTEVLQAWDITDPSTPSALTGPVFAQARDLGIVSLTLSRDGRILATSDFDGAIQLWDFSDPARIVPFGNLLVAHTRQAVVALSPDGQRLATGSCHDNQTRTIACAGEVRLWDISDPLAPRPLGEAALGQTDLVNTIAFSPDGQTLATGSTDTTIQLWDVSGPGAARPLGGSLPGHTSWIETLVFSPDGTTLASGGGEDGIRFWDVSNTIKPTPIRVSLAVNGRGFAFAEAGKTLVAALGRAVIRWDVEDLNSTPSLGVQLLDFSNSVSSVSFSVDGKTLALGNRVGDVQLWNVSDPTAPYISGGLTQPEWVLEMAFNKAGVLAIADSNSIVRLWDVTDASSADLLSTEIPGTGPLAFSPEGNVLAVGNREAAVALWEVSNPAVPRWLGQLDVSGSSVRRLTFDLDGKTLAVSGDDFALWDIAEPAKPRQLSVLPVGQFLDNAMYNPVRSLVATLNSEGSDSGLRLWDMSDPAAPKMVGTLLEGENISSAALVPDLTFSPDGNLLVTGGEGDLQVWEVSDSANPRPLGPPLGQGAYFIGYSPDERTMVTEGAQGVILWPMMPSMWVERACALAGRNFTQSEWHRYVGDAIAYHVTCEQWPAGE